MKILDNIIIGSGISGLYTAYHLQKKGNENFIILEKNCKIGGRIQTFQINDNKVSMGAGVGRKSDIHLINLLNDLNIEHSSGMSHFYYSNNMVMINIYQIINNTKRIGNVKNNIENVYSKKISEYFFEILKIPDNHDYDQVIEFLEHNLSNLLKGRPREKKDKFDFLVYYHIENIYDKLKKYLDYQLKNNIYKPISFRNFCLEILDIKTYEVFIKNLSFTDYEDEDAYISLMYYNFEDNFKDQELIYIKWDNLISIFQNHLFKKIILNTKLINIQEMNDGVFELICEQYIETDSKIKNIMKYYCKKVIFANNLDVVNKYYDYNIVKNQPFLRVYCVLNVNQSFKFIDLIKVNGSTIVDNQLCKIININRDDGIFMISYCDNNNAKLLNFYKDNNDTNKKIFEKLLAEAFKLSENDIFIENIYPFYWTLGTHYFKLDNNINNYDLDKLLYQLQLPFENIFVVGECLCKNQGWCEGALESVNNILEFL